MSVNEKMTAIANDLRMYTGGTELLSLDDMPMKIQEVYSVGNSDGFDLGYRSGYNEGKQAEYDAFWDVFQKYGNEANYGYAFSYGKFTDANYKPKYPILTSAGITTASSTFYEAKDITDIKVPFICKGTRAYETFYSCFNLVKIPEFNVTQDTVFRSTFSQDRALEELNITGTIGQNGFDIHWSTKLNKASIESIINALSADTSGLTVTLSQTAVNNAFTAEEWEALEATKTNWNISLV